MCLLIESGEKELILQPFPLIIFNLCFATNSSSRCESRAKLPEFVESNPGPTGRGWSL